MSGGSGVQAPPIPTSPGQRGQTPAFSLLAPARDILLPSHQFLRGPSLALAHPYMEGPPASTQG